MQMHETAEFVSLNQLLNHYDGVSESLATAVQNIIDETIIGDHWDKFSEEQQAMINKALDNQWEPHFGQENLEN